MYFVENFLAIGMPDVAFWFQVMLCEVKIDGVNELGDRSKAARQYRLLAEIAEEGSTMVIYEALVGVKCK